MNNATTKMPPSFSSQLSSHISQLYLNHQKTIQRLDDLESQLESRVAAHRRRATNLLEESPTHRRTHLRIFVSHRVEEGGGDGNCHDEDDGHGGAEKKEEKQGEKGERETSKRQQSFEKVPLSSTPPPHTTHVPGGFAGSLSSLLAASKAKNELAPEKAILITSCPKKSTAATAPARGGKDFNTLLHSSAHSAEKITKEIDNDDDGESSEKEDMLDKKNVRRWTLVIEGGLLVGYLDRESSDGADLQLEQGLSVLGRVDDEIGLKGEEIKDRVFKTKGDSSSESKYGGSGSPKAMTASSSPIPTSNKAIPLRDQWRGGEKEGEIAVDPIIFTHCFNKLEVELKIMKRPSTEDSPLLSSAAKGVVQDEQNNECLVPTFATLKWERSKADTPDANAFFVAHTEEGIMKPVENTTSKDEGGNVPAGKVKRDLKPEFRTEFIDAKIKLFPRQGEEGSYIPSEEMCNIFFPTFVGKKPLGQPISKSKKLSIKKRKRSSNEGGDFTISNLIQKTEGVPSKELSAESFLPRDELPLCTLSSATEQNTYTGYEEKDVNICNTITMGEALHAVLFYVRSRNLQDATDLSIINNDETLSMLFGCNRMLLSAVRGLLLQNELLVNVEEFSHPVVFNYKLTLDGAEPSTKLAISAKQQQASIKSKRDDDVIAQSGEISTRRRMADESVVAEANSMNKKSSELGNSARGSFPLQTMLSCDVDVEIPTLYHLRTRDILRRTKYREFEYTSSRAKAAKSLMATKVDEEITKSILEDVVTGKGYTSHHKQGWMVLAKGSHDGGEAQRAAWIGLRTTALMEKLEEKCSQVQCYWDVVGACLSL